MRRVMLASLIGVTAMLALGASAPAAWATNTVTFHIHDGTATMPSRNPCTGVHGTVTLHFNAVFHKTKIGPGLVHVTETTAGTFEFVPKISKFSSYTGHFTQWDGFNMNTHNLNGTFTFHVNGMGSDGSHLVFHEVAHFSISPSGVQMQFDKPTCSST
jgi:hypothetical protein